MSKVKLFEGLQARQARFAQPTLHHMALALFDLCRQQGFQISYVAESLLNGLVGKLLKLGRNGRGPQLFAIVTNRDWLQSSGGGTHTLTSNSWSKCVISGSGRS